MSQRSSEGAKTLPGRYFTAPDVYDRERERIFQRRWLCVGLATSLPEPGQYVLVDIEGESCILLRDREGALRAFQNVCRHRGTRLCDATSGRLSKYIVCPYHAWAYDLRGDLVTSPNMDEVVGFDRGQFPLHPIATGVWEGLVFINLHPDPEPLEEALAPLIGKFDSWRLSELVSVHQTRYEVGANWKLLFQNYSECYHCPSLHPALNKLTPFRDARNDLEAGPVLGGPMQLSRGNASMTTDGRACAPSLGDLSGEQLRLVHYYVVFPSFFLSLMPDYALVHRVLRRGPAQTTVLCDWLFHPEAVTAPGFDPTPAVEFWDTTNRQDWRICERSQDGIGSRAYEPGPYSNLESMVAAFDREYLGALQDQG